MDIITASESVCCEKENSGAAGASEAPSCPYPARTCGCVGYGYVPVQELKEIYDCCKGLEQGTIFPELDLNIDEYGCVCKQLGGVSV